MKFGLEKKSGKRSKQSLLTEQTNGEGSQEARRETEEEEEPPDYPRITTRRRPRSRPPKLTD